MKTFTVHRVFHSLLKKEDYKAFMCITNAYCMPWDIKKVQGRLDKWLSGEDKHWGLEYIYLPLKCKAPINDMDADEYTRPWGELDRMLSPLENMDVETLKLIMSGVEA